MLLRNRFVAGVAVMALATAIGYANTAAAQAASPQTPKNASDEGTTVGEVIVTGTRLPSAQNLVLPTPVAVVGSKELQDLGVINLGDALSQIPSLGYVGSIRGNEDGGSNSGLDTPDLRNLGASRTLTLVDGQRHVAGAPGTSSVDLSSIPPTLVDRVEVTTGGSSAIYGSDAVSGVVNIITKKNLNGVAADFNFVSATDGSYDRGYNASITVGRNFDGGRGNAAFTVLYSHSDAVQADQIKALRNGAQITNQQDCGAAAVPNNNPNLCAAVPNNGIPDNFLVANVGSNLISSTGVIDLALLNGIFPPGGIPGAGFQNIGFTPSGDPIDQPFFSGNNNNAFGQLPANCASCFFGQQYEDIVPDITRKGFFTNIHYDVTPHFQLTVDAKYVEENVTTLFQPSFAFSGVSLNDGSNGFVPTSIAPDNAFRTTAINNAINNSISAVLTPGQIAAVFGPGGPNANSLPYSAFIGPSRGFSDTRDTARIVVGGNGDFDTAVADFHYDGALNYGQNSQNFVQPGELINGNFLAALDSVIDPGTGQAACRINVPSAQGPGFAAPTGLTKPASACVPYNPFGRPTAASLAYVETTLDNTALITQADINFNVHFDSSKFFHFPGGGPIAIAAGVEYHRETSSNGADALALQGLTEEAAAPPVSGAIDNTDVYGEARLPVLSHMPFAEDLSFDMAVRESNYHPFGSVNTWDVGFTYEPFRRDLTGWLQPLSGLKFRGTDSSPTRAPNINEAFSPPTPGFANIADPCATSNISTGNANRAANCAALGITQPFNPNTAASINTISEGNPALKPETAHTYTVGFVYQPTWIKSLAITVDYYNIDITNVIEQIPIQDVINDCVDSASINNTFCAAIDRAPSTAGARAFNILSVTDAFINAAALQTHGVDFQAVYRHNVEQWTAGLGPLKMLTGVFTASLDGNWTQANRNLPFQNSPGDQNVNEGTIGIPAERATLDLDYKQNNWDVAWRTRFVSRSALFGTGTGNLALSEGCEQISPCQIPAQVYNDLTGSYKFNTPYGTAEIYGGIHNIFDVQMPGLGTTFSAEYEIYGRTINVGLRLKM
jgi:iron complex outermembrane receptor protein